MYLRLQASYNSEYTGKPCGVFGAVHHLKQKGLLSDDEIRLLEEIESWFEENLPNPPFYEQGNSNRATTWFKASARCMIDKLLPLKEIAGRHGVLLEIAETDCPGQIIYEDEHQVAAT